MERRYWEALSDIIMILNESSTLVYLRNSENMLEVIVKCLDEDVLSDVDVLCEENGLCYTYCPYTYMYKRSLQVIEMPGVLFTFTAIS